LEQAEYVITVGVTADEKETTTQAQQAWQQWIDDVQRSDAIWFEYTTKSGNPQTINLRDRLFNLTVETIADDATIALRYMGSHRNDGTLLRPDHVIYMLEQVSGQELQLLHVHRDRLILATPEA
jgi:uncharacterized protein (DUF2344 family)